jgi:peptide deformylase
MDKPKPAMRKILLCTHPVLRRKAAAIKRVDRDIRRLLDEMVETMQAAPGLGLAAPQVGESIRCAVVATPDDGVRRLINPRIVRREGEVVGPEGCLSLPTLQARVPRAREITIKALNERMRPDTFVAEGLYARAIQHELDHLNGVLFIDHAVDDTLAWQVPDDDAEDGYRLEVTTIDDAMRVFERLEREQDREE